MFPNFSNSFRRTAFLQCLRAVDATRILLAAIALMAASVAQAQSCSPSGGSGYFVAQTGTAANVQYGFNTLCSQVAWRLLDVFAGDDASTQTTPVTGGVSSVNIAVGTIAARRRVEACGLPGGSCTTLELNVLAVSCSPSANPTSIQAGATSTVSANCTITSDANSTGTVSSYSWSFPSGAPTIGNTQASAALTFPNAGSYTYRINPRIQVSPASLPTAIRTFDVTVAPSAVVTVSSVNQPPTAAITAPANNSTVTLPPGQTTTTVNFTVNASDPDGTVASVQYFANGTAIGTSTTAPFGFVWNNVAAGSYSITARATDNLNLQGAASVPIALTVVPANQPPTASITAPPNNATFVAPATININANAADPDGTIQSVEFFNGTTLLGTSTTAPYTFAWTNVAAGTYALTVRATDNLNAQTTSAAVSVTVNAPNQPPAVSVTAPANNATFIAPAAINITANASDPDGTIQRVEFLNGATLLGTSTTAPYSFNWTNVAVGTYAVTARAFDNAGASTTSAIVNVIINPRANVAPTVALTAPVNGRTFVAPASILVQANAADSDGTVQRVEFFNGSTLLGTSTAAPFSFSWVNVPEGDYTLTARATDNSNATTVSATVSVSVRPPVVPVPTIACAVELSPATISTRDGVTLRANCTRNNAPFVVGVGETVTYQWTAGAQSPAIPAGAQRAETLNLPAGTFTRAGSFEYRVVATLTSTAFTGSAISNTATGTVSVNRKVGKIEIVTPPGGLKIQPGVESSFTVKAMDDQGGVPGVTVSWRIDNGNTKANAKAATRKATCPDADTPNSGPLPPTSASGETTLRFTPSCASGGRSITLAAEGVSQTFNLAGPNQSATKLMLLNQGALFVVEPNKLTQIPVSVEESGGGKVAAASTVWQLIPNDAGTITSPAISNDSGEARSIVVLKEGVAAAVARVCIDGRTDVCVDIQLRNTKLAIQAPAQAIVQPMVRQSIDAPRAQLNNIRNRLQQLRVEENSGDGASSKSGAGALPKVSGLGLFVLGDVEIAKRDPSNGDRGYKLRTKGVTIGADYRPTKDVVVGGAVGALRGDTTAGIGGDQRSKGYSGSLFAQWLPSKNWYTNMIVSAGKNTYDSTRSGSNGETLRARGSSTQQGVQVEAGYSLAKDATRFTPFVRYEFIRAKLKPFEESGGADAVAINGQTVRSNTLGIGAVAEHAFSTTSGVWVPSARLEFLRESQSQSEVFARLVNGTPVLVPLNEELIDKSYGTIGVNLQWLTGVSGNLTSSFIGYERTIGKSGFQNDRFTAGVKIPF